MSNYKPSTLLVEVPDSDIDNKLGVRNLVSHSQPQAEQQTPVAKSRSSVDQWSNSNGSVIYAQSNNVKSGLTYPTTNGESNNTHDGDTQANGKISSISAIYLNGDANNKSVMNRCALQPVQSGHSTIYRAKDTKGPGASEQNEKLANQSPPVAATLASAVKENSTMIDSLTQDENDLNRVDMSNNSNTNWSNGTNANSDLLF